MRGSSDSGTPCAATTAWSSSHLEDWSDQSSVTRWMVVSSTHLQTRTSWSMWLEAYISPLCELQNQRRAHCICSADATWPHRISHRPWWGRQLSNLQSEGIPIEFLHVPCSFFLETHWVSPFRGQGRRSREVCRWISCVLLVVWITLEACARIISRCAEDPLRDRREWISKGRAKKNK